jgi:hypothetical protein
VLCAAAASAGPEVAMREFASSQIKKGVRVLGMGGDGATWGNYSLNWKDASTALVDYGGTFFTDTGNDFHFVAVGVTTPPFWKDAALYLIAMAEWASDLRIHLKSPAFPSGADLRGEGSDQAVFLKFAKPIRHGVSLGMLLGWERSALTSVDRAGGGYLNYTTPGLPSVGGGITWQAMPQLLLGARFLLNNDWETRTDARSTSSGWYHSWEWRLGVSVRVWRGGLFDVGYVGLWRGSAVDGTERIEHALVAGFEQELWPRHLVVRLGWNETAPTGGLTVRFWKLKLDLAYVYKLGVDRTNGVFGNVDHSLLASLILDYAPRRR